jgi:transcriptional regulator with GAF, ATPase, and Fis domain
MGKQADYIRESLSAIMSGNYSPRQLMAEVYVLLSQHFPIDTMHIPVLDSENRTLTYKVFIINRKVMLLNEVIPLSENAMKIADVVKNQKFVHINDSNRIPPVKEIANHFKVKASVSLLALVFPVAGGFHSGLTLAAYGDNRYRKEHVDLLNSLSEDLSAIAGGVLSAIGKDSRNGKKLSNIMEIRNLLEHQRIDLSLNSQSGLKNILNQVEQVGPLDSPVLIIGETGVGKELIARLLHGVSKRSRGPFIAVNCGALPESLLDSELFGYEKGAFTGASQQKPGYFEQADKGVLFLDEVGELTLQAQTKLLRAIQHQVFHRVGGTTPVSVDVRVIAATHRVIPDMIRSKTFREDLWYRLNVFPIEVPPLRDRKSDIPLLVQYLVNSKLYEMNLSFEPVLAPEAMGQLTSYDWPGNIRELQNVLERALILSRGTPMSFPHLVSRTAGNQDENELFSYGEGKFPSMDQMIARHIHKSLELSKGKIGGPGGAADLLGMNPSTLRARMKKLNIRIGKVPKSLGSIKTQ